jgi:LPXTG-motif cell wall-anchored protein
MDQLRIPDDPEGIEEPHDVLAAEEFAMPARGDYGLHLPRDPYGDKPHDVLAADEFAMPSGPDRVVQALKSGDTSNSLVILGAAALAALLIYAALRRR